MELDKRVKEGRRPLTCFDLKEASDFLEKTGYFTNELDNFSDLSEIGCFSEVQFGRLLKINNNKRCAFKYLSMDGSYENSYRFFLPEDWVLPKEKKYRPFTLDEWIGQHTMGDVIRYRCKSQKIELRHMYVGYAYGIGTDIKNTTSGTLTLGDSSYSLECLFEDYEIKVDGEWQPFGVLDE